jgi:hypothetical protein
MKRTDIHRPSAVNPEDYEFVAMECVPGAFEGDIEACYAQIEARERIRAHMAATGGTYSGHEHGGNCMVCGCANMIYSCLFYHEKTNSYIRTGQDCADKMEMGDPVAFNRFRAAIQDWREAKAGQRKAIATLAEKGLSRAWEIRNEYQASATVRAPLYNAFDAAWNANENSAETNAARRALQEFDYRWLAASKINDILYKLVKYGSISDKAMNYVGILINQHDNADRIIAERKAEKESAAPCPTGRVTVTGTVLKVEEREGNYGMTLKMTVKATEGFIVWSTVPSGAQVERGSAITFKATVTPSDRDPKFGFAKLPKLVNAPAAA